MPGLGRAGDGCYEFGPGSAASDMNWMHRIRLRVFALLVAAALVVIGVVSVMAVPVWPVIGVAAATVALVVNRMTARLSEPVCWECGGDLAQLRAGEYGIACPQCGAINESRPGA